jgi:hypothetical protein
MYDVAYATLAVAHVHGLPFTIIAPGIGYAPGKVAAAIMVPVNSPAQSGKDLNGKLLGAAALNTIAEYLPRAWIDKTGGDSTSVKFVEIAFPATSTRSRQAASMQRTWSSRSSRSHRKSEWIDDQFVRSCSRRVHIGTALVVRHAPLGG